MPDFQSFGGSLALLGGMVAIIRRKHAVGGWLLYFFWQVLLGLALTAGTTHWRQYLSLEWTDAGRYFLFTVSSLSRMFLLAAVGGVSVSMLHSREWRWVGALQYTLLTYAFLTLLKLPVDVYCSPESFSRDTLSLAFPCVWIFYFAVSRRVRYVFHAAP